MGDTEVIKLSDIVKTLSFCQKIEQPWHLSSSIWERLCQGRVLQTASALRSGSEASFWESPPFLVPAFSSFLKALVTDLPLMVLTLGKGSFMLFFDTSTYGKVILIAVSYHASFCGLQDTTFAGCEGDFILTHKDSDLTRPMGVQSYWCGACRVKAVTPTSPKSLLEQTFLFWSLMMPSLEIQSLDSGLQITVCWKFKVGTTALHFFHSSNVNETLYIVSAVSDSSKPAMDAIVIVWLPGSSTL
ncbi:hypothetical protein STEG23_028758, partial [Scotinomys teguina]